eukprot:Clim_evm10s147 gene=Clim_evmTU10s147
MTDNITKNIQAAEAAMKTGFFKRTPDYAAAAAFYDKAAKEMALKGQKNEAIAVYTKACEAHKGANSLFGVGKSLELASSIAKDLGLWENFVDFTDRAASAYAENGSPDSATGLLEKNAKHLEGKDDMKAAEFYLRACRYAEIEEKYLTHAYKRAVAMYIRSNAMSELKEALKNYADCMRTFGQIDMLHQIYLEQIVAFLKADRDYVAANRYFNEVAGNNSFGLSECGLAAQQLLQAWDETDQEAWDRLARTSPVKYLDNEVLKMIRSMRVPGEGKKKAPMSATADDNATTSLPTGASTSGTVAAAAEEEDDEDLL